MTPLHVAVLAGKVGVVTILIEKGANPKAKNKNGRTPLQVATYKGYQAIVDLLTKGSAQ